MRLILLITAVLFSTIDATGADDLVHPAGTSVTSRYSVNSLSFTLGDTLIISRTLVNNSASTISFVSFSETVPVAFLPDTVICRVNGIITEIGTFGPFTDSLLSANNSYHWVLDSPVPSENLSFLVLPADSFEITAKFICNDVGDFTLPFHSTIGITNGTALFAEGDSVNLQVRLSLDIDNDLYPLVPNSPLIARAWPNPFNPSVTIEYETTKSTGQIDLTIYDVLGRTVHNQTQPVVDGNGSFRWTADYSTGSGTYFYRLTTSSEKTVGKLILVK